MYYAFMDSLFKFHSYQAIVEHQLLVENLQKGAKSRLAKAAGIQPAYLSHVLAGKAHLSLDQAADMAAFWDFSESETDYFLTLVAFGRSGSLKLKRHLEKKLKGIRKVSENPFADENAKMDLELAANYYSDAVYSAIHLLLRIEELQSIDSLASHLRLEKNEVRKYLDQMETLGLVRHAQNRWFAIERNFHAEPDSPFAKMHHRNWRLRTVDSLKRNDVHDLHYTGIHTLSEDDFEKIRTVFLDAIRKSRK